MGEFFAGIVLLIAIGGALYYVVTNSYKRAVARHRSEKWAKQLRHLGNNMPLPSEASFPLRHGEEFVMNLKDVSLAEGRRAPRVTTRRTDALTLALAKGVYYTAAGGKSISPEPDELISEIDTGTATFTTHRVVFVGSKQTREWDFAKLLGATEGAGGLRVMFAVSNRQKMSGIAQASIDQIAPGLAYQITMGAREDGWETARNMCLKGALEIEAQTNFMNESFFVTEEKIGQQMEQWRARNMKTNDAPAKNPSPTSATTSAPIVQKEPEPLDEIQVVGEFFYKKSFEALREQLKSDGDTEHIVEAELRNDPDNEYSDSGKAVAVFIRDKKVGHVPEWLAPKVFDKLEPEGGTVTLGARLYLDHPTAKPQKNSVTVKLDSRLVIV
ncbi:MAG: hypothetical protein K9G08_03075 [Pontimonas sp.]|nr:hypothetical protein [Pontimonas sp.]